MGTWLLVIIIGLLLLAMHRIDILQRRVERLHVKVNAIRRAVAPDAPQTDVEVADLHSVTDTIQVLKHN